MKKHLTKAEKSARREAEASLESGRRIYLRAPKWLDPNADMGTHTFRYSIVPHRGTWRSGTTWKAADELNRPLRTLAVAQHAGTGRSLSMLNVEGSDVQLSGLKLAEDNDNWIVRVVANNGVAANAVVDIPGATEWRIVDFVERPRGQGCAQLSTICGELSTEWIGAYIAFPLSHFSSGDQVTGSPPG